MKKRERKTEQNNQKTNIEVKNNILTICGRRDDHIDVIDYTLLWTFIKKLTSNLLIYFGRRTAAWQVIHSANIS